MTTIYRTRQGEMVDAICRRVYGDESGYAEAVLDANPGLAASAETLPAGQMLVLPDVIVQTEASKIVQLWN